MRIGLFGGSFNPAHAGHLAISLEALRRLRLDRVWWLVSPLNPLKSAHDIAPLDDRLTVARAMARHPRIVVSDIERHLGTRFTIDTATAIARRWPRTRFVWIAGADILGEFHHWRAWPKLARTVAFAVFDRPGFGHSAFGTPFAVRYRTARVDETDAAHLVLTEPPAWSFLHIPLRPEAATDLRT